VGQGPHDGGALCWQEAAEGEHVAQGPAHRRVPRLGGNRPALSMLPWYHMRWDYIWYDIRIKEMT
jgi:hypothetical protein